MVTKSLQLKKHIFTSVVLASSLLTTSVSHASSSYQAQQQKSDPRQSESFCEVAPVVQVDAQEQKNQVQQVDQKKNWTLDEVAHNALAQKLSHTADSKEEKMLYKRVNSFYKTLKKESKKSRKAEKQVIKDKRKRDQDNENSEVLDEKKVKQDLNWLKQKFKNAGTKMKMAFGDLKYEMTRNFKNPKLKHAYKVKSYSKMYYKLCSTFPTLDGLETWLEDKITEHYEDLKMSVGKDLPEDLAVAYTQWKTLAASYSSKSEKKQKETKAL